MKKELFAGALLLVLIGLCAWNLWYLTRMCTQLDDAVAQAETSYAAGDPARTIETLAEEAAARGLTLFGTLFAPDYKVPPKLAAFRELIMNMREESEK